jgi:hypothetical protein
LAVLVLTGAAVLAGCAEDHASSGPRPDETSKTGVGGDAASGTPSSTFTSLAEETGDRARAKLGRMLAKMRAADTGAFVVDTDLDGFVIRTRGEYRMSDQSSATTVSFETGEGPTSYRTVSDQDHVWLRLTEAPGGVGWPCWLELDDTTLPTVDAIFPGVHIGLPAALSLVTEAEAIQLNADLSLQVEAPLADMFDAAASPLRERIGIGPEDDHTIWTRLDPDPDDGSFVSSSFPVIQLLTLAEQDGYHVPKDLDQWMPDRRNDNRVAASVRELGREVSIERPGAGESVTLHGTDSDAIGSAVASCVSANA